MHARGDLGRRRRTCGSIAPLLAGVAAGDARLEGEALDHVESCLRCQAELARYRRLRRTLRTLGEPDVVPGPEVLPSILASLERAGLPRVGWGAARWAVVAGAAFGCTVVAGGALWAARHHRRLAAG